MRNFKKEYSEKLKDPRWQKKRLKILERDEWTCQYCLDSETTLHVHHLKYSGADPWDAPDDNLTTACADCHEREGEARREHEAILLEALRLRKISSDDVHGLACDFFSMPNVAFTGSLMMTICWAIRNESVLRELQKMYDERYPKLKENDVQQAVH